LGGNCTGLRWDTNTERTSGCGELDNLGTASVRLSSVMVAVKKVGTVISSTGLSNHMVVITGGYQVSIDAGLVEEYCVMLLCVCTVGMVDRLDIYKVIYITTRFSQPYNMESQKG
jgi:hypothetical protein